MRWAEEVELIQEEMRRVLAFLKWQAEWWRAQGGDLMHVNDVTIRDGMKAYRERQARIREDLYDRFEFMWRGRDHLLSQS